MLLTKKIPADFCLPLVNPSRNSPTCKALHLLKSVNFYAVYYVRVLLTNYIRNRLSLFKCQCWFTHRRKGVYTSPILYSGFETCMFICLREPLYTHTHLSMRGERSSLYSLVNVYSWNSCSEISLHHLQGEVMAVCMEGSQYTIESFECEQPKCMHRPIVF